MSKPEQVLRIEPQYELKFQGPFKVPVTSYMTLTNPSDKKVIFKIKTTAPKKYCVRPNSGFLDPNETIKLAICLQPFTFDPSEKNKHKFMVQSLFAPEGEMNIEQLWKEINPDQLMDSKLKCVFEMPPDAMESGEEPAKISPKVSTLNAAASNPTANFSVLESDLKSATSEIQQMSEEISNLRAENLRLKEQMLQMKMEGQSRTSSGIGLGVAPTKYQPAVQVQQSVMFKRLATSLAVVIVGIILGKYVL